MIIIQKTSKRDISGNTVYTPLSSTYIILMGGKITVKLLLGHQSSELRFSLLNAYLALFTIYTILPFNFINIIKLSYPALCSHLNTLYIYTPAVLLLPPYLPPSVSFIPFYLPASNIALNLVLKYTKP